MPGEHVAEENIWAYGGGSGSWKKLHNDESHNFNASPNITTVIKLRIMRWAGHEASL
jgi:hypothetical protein